MSLEMTFSFRLAMLKWKHVEILLNMVIFMTALPRWLLSRYGRALSPLWADPFWLSNAEHVEKRLVSTSNQDWEANRINLCGGILKSPQRETSEVFQPFLENSEGGNTVTWVPGAIHFYKLKWLPQGKQPSAEESQFTNTEWPKASFNYLHDDFNTT